MVLTQNREPGVKDAAQVVSSNGAGQSIVRLISDLPGVVYRCLNDASWSMEFISDNIYALSGYRPKDLIKNRRLSFGDMIHPDDRDRVWSRIQAKVAEGDHFEIIYRIITAGGVKKWVWEKGHAVSGALAALLASLIVTFIILDLVDHIKEEKEKLQQAISKVKILSGLLPFCSSCKKIRDDSGYWNRIEAYIRDHLEAEFTHSICPECQERIYPGL